MSRDASGMAQGSDSSRVCMETEDDCRTKKYILECEKQDFGCRSEIHVHTFY